MQHAIEPSEQHAGGRASESEQREHADVHCKRIGEEVEAREGGEDEQKVAGLVAQLERGTHRQQRVCSAAKAPKG